MAFGWGIHSEFTDGKGRFLQADGDFPIMGLADGWRLKLHRVDFCTSATGRWNEPEEVK